MGPQRAFPASSQLIEMLQGRGPCFEPQILYLPQKPTRKNSTEASAYLCDWLVFKNGKRGAFRSTCWLLTFLNPFCQGLLTDIFRPFKFNVLQVALVVKNPPANAADATDVSWLSGSGRSLEKKRQPSPVFLPGDSLGQRSLTGYSP